MELSSEKRIQQTKGKKLIRQKYEIGSSIQDTCYNFINNEVFDVVLLRDALLGPGHEYCF